MQKNKGFSLIEIILAMAIVVIVFISVFDFAASAYMRTTLVQDKKDFYFSYQYGESYCEQYKNSDDINFLTENNISFSSYISTSTKVTSIHMMSPTRFLITTDSSSTTESDVFIFEIDFFAKSTTLVASIDVGPGIQDSKLLDSYLYIANTSVNSHVKTIYIDNSALVGSSTDMFRELSNVKLLTLAASVSNPKKLSIYDNNLILGSEKSNTGGELFVLPIEQDGEVRFASHMIETGGQVNQTISSHHAMYVANAADPELRAYDLKLAEFFSYDAPLTLGNGKSVLYMPPYIVLGRTLGSGELSVLRSNSTAVEVLDTRRTNGTVDYVQRLEKVKDVSIEKEGKHFVTITANEDKELQFWNIEKTIQGAKLILGGEVDIPGRVTSYTCSNMRIYLFVFIDNQPTLIWIEL